jgi:hypothetical protein
MTAHDSVIQPLLTLGSEVDGEAAFMEIIRSAGRALTQNQAAAPLVGLGILTVLIVLADWKFAGWIERAWRRRGSGRHAPAGQARSDERAAHR